MNLHFKSESMEGWSVCLVVSCIGGFKGSEKNLLMRMVFNWGEGVAGGGHCLELKFIYKRYT